MADGTDEQIEEGEKKKKRNNTKQNALCVDMAMATDIDT